MIEALKCDQLIGIETTITGEFYFKNTLRSVELIVPIKVF